jgi:hypothetical protein
MEIKANSEEDLKLLAKAFLTTPRETYWVLMAKVHQLGLMRFRGFNKILLELLKKIRGEEYIFYFFNLLDKVYPKGVEEALYETARHIVNGKDTEDEDSVGGWSQREIDLLLSTINFSSLK